MHNRESERERLAQKLKNGTNIHMPAPRRIGKTSTLNRLAKDLRNEGWLIVELDVQGKSTPEDFARLLCQKIQRADIRWCPFDHCFRSTDEKYHRRGLQCKSR